VTGTQSAAANVRITCFDERIWQLQQPLSPELPLHVHLLVGGTAVLIDTGLASTYPLIGELFAAAGVRPSDVRLIMNTHAHHDHIGSNRRVQHDTGALVVAAAGSEPWIEDHQRQLREFAFHHPDIIPDTPAVRDELQESLDGEVRVDILPAEGTRFRLGQDVDIQVLSLPGHVEAELGYYERSTGTLILGDAVTGVDWLFFHGHVRPRAYRASIAKLKSLAATVPIRRALLAHYPLLSGAEFVALLDTVEAYIDTLDRTILDIVSRADGSLDLETIWRAVSQAMHKTLEFRGLATVDGHLRELTADGKLSRVGPDRYAWIDN
jgi:glyoxylase-like metal-dependent hydrolase (beta-lactamase superfamily II)